MKIRNNTKARDLQKEKSNKKLEALSRWKRGEKIVQISRDLRVSRDSVYRWVSRSNEVLSQSVSKRSISVDTLTKYKIIEAYFLLKRPSMVKLSGALKHHFGLKIPAFSLRRYLKKWGLFDYKPSPFFDIILLEQGWRRVSSSTSFDEAQDGEISP